MNMSNKKHKEADGSRGQRNNKTAILAYRTTCCNRKQIHMSVTLDISDESSQIYCVIAKNEEGHTNHRQHRNRTLGTISQMLHNLVFV